MLTKSKLGFGLMRLPHEGDAIKIEEVKTMVDAYLAAGLNYFDTAYVYEGSEEATKKALVERHPRESFTLADKLPGWKIHKQEDVERIFNESLTRCGVDYFDFYLLHSIEAGHIEIYEKYHCFEFLKRMKEEGKIRHMGFSFHDSPELLDEVLSRHPEVEFVQLQINYLDWENGVITSRRNYEVARKHGKQIIIMEPVKGGTLAQMTPENEALFKAKRPDDSIASWALRFAASLDGVMTVLSGMSDESQMKDNLKTFTHFEPLSAQEERVIEDVRKNMLSYPTIPCTSCHYCVEGCPMKINIPELFNAYNSKKLYGRSQKYQNHYNRFTEEGHGKAKACIACGQCERVCPQHLSIINLLKDVSELFDGKGN